MKKIIVIVIVQSLTIISINLFNKNNYVFEKTFYDDTIPGSSYNIRIDNNLTIDLEIVHYRSCVNCTPAVKKYSINILLVVITIILLFNVKVLIKNKI